VATDKIHGDYIPIELASLRLDTIQSFDLYLRVKGNKYVLYLAGSNALTEDALLELTRKRVANLYISSDHEEAYRQYVEEQLPYIIRDPGISPDDKARVVYDTAITVVRDMFDEPREDVIKRAKDVVTSTVALILTDDDANVKLTQLTSHDYFTYTHSVNVCIYCISLAKRSFPSISDEEFQRLGAGFMFHDIGKCEISSKILQKQGPLGEDEWEIVRRHPEASYRILKETGHLTVEAGLIAMQHHERVDGSGYPEGLKNGAIDEFAQMCAIADVFDALTTNRVHRPAMHSFDALNLMKTEMRGCFSQEHYDNFVLVFAGGK
jgi:HD-GYP domain-containing protein (c-di-GMP phosphodiesterase class II)